MLTQDVAKALRTLPDIEVHRRREVEEMAEGLELFCTGIQGHFFNREVYNEAMTNLVKMHRNDDFEEVGSKWRPTRTVMQDFKFRTKDTFEIKWPSSPTVPPTLRSQGLRRRAGAASGAEVASAPAEPCSVIAGSGRRADRFLTERLGFRANDPWSGLCPQRGHKPSEGGTDHGDETHASEAEPDVVTHSDGWETSWRTDRGMVTFKNGDKRERGDCDERNKNGSAFGAESDPRGRRGVSDDGVSR